MGHLFHLFGKSANTPGRGVWWISHTRPIRGNDRISFVSKRGCILGQENVGTKNTRFVCLQRNFNVLNKNIFEVLLVDFKVLVFNHFVKFSTCDDVRRVDMAKSNQKSYLTIINSEFITM